MTVIDVVEYEAICRDRHDETVGTAKSLNGIGGCASLRGAGRRDEFAQTEVVPKLPALRYATTRKDYGVVDGMVAGLLPGTRRKRIAAARAIIGCLVGTVIPITIVGPCTSHRQAKIERLLDDFLPKAHDEEPESSRDKQMPFLLSNTIDGLVGALHGRIVEIGDGPYGAVGMEDVDEAVGIDHSHAISFLTVADIHNPGAGEAVFAGQFLFDSPSRDTGTHKTIALENVKIVPQATSAAVVLRIGKCLPFASDGGKGQEEDKER